MDSNFGRSEISVRTLTVNLSVKHNVVSAANTASQAKMIYKLPSHSILPKLPIKLKFVKPEKTNS